ERRIAAVLLPSILLSGRAVANDIAGGGFDHLGVAGRLRTIDGAGAQQHVVKQDRKSGLVHLDAAPIRPAVEPGILYPMPVGFLDRHEIAQDAFSGVCRTGREQPAGNLDEIAWPNQMVAAKIVIALGRAPRNRQTCDDCAGRRFSMRRHDHRADAIAIKALLVARLIEWQERLLPLSPAGSKIRQRRTCTALKAYQGPERCLLSMCTEADREQRSPATGGQVDGARQCDIAVFGALIVRSQSFAPE